MWLLFNLVIPAILIVVLFFVIFMHSKFRARMCGFLGVMCERSEFQDGTIFKFTLEMYISNNGPKYRVRQKVITTKDLAAYKRTLGKEYTGHFHINGVNTTIDKLKDFYKGMYCYANNIELQEIKGEAPENNIPVYFIYNCTSIWRGFREKFFVGKAWGKNIHSIYENNPAAQTLYKLASMGLVTNVSAHSNGNVAALCAFHQLNKDESQARVTKGEDVATTNHGESVLKNITYHALSLQAHNNLIQPEILAMLGDNTTYYFNLEESYSSMFKLNTIPVEVIVEFIYKKWVKEGWVMKESDESSVASMEHLSEHCKELGPRLGAFKHSGKKMYYIFNLCKKGEKKTLSIKGLLSLPFRCLAECKKKAEEKKAKNKNAKNKNANIRYPVVECLFWMIRGGFKLRYLLLVPVIGPILVFIASIIREILLSLIAISQNPAIILSSPRSLIEGMACRVNEVKVILYRENVAHCGGIENFLYDNTFWLWLGLFLITCAYIWISFCVLNPFKEHDMKGFCLRSWRDFYAQNQKSISNNFTIAIDKQKS